MEQADINRNSPVLLYLLHGNQVVYVGELVGWGGTRLRLVIILIATERVIGQ